MNWNPNQFGPPGAQPPGAPQNNPQPGWAPPAAPQGFVPGQAPAGAPTGYQPQPGPVAGRPAYGGPVQAPGYAAPAGGGFRPVAPTSLDDRTPDVPDGNHILVVKSGPELVGQNRDLVVVLFEVEQSDTVRPGTVGAWKRSLKQTHPASNQMASNDIAKLAVPLSGRQKDQTDMQEAFRLVSEFMGTGTLDGQPIIGRRVGATVTPGTKINTKTGRPWPAFQFHTL
jgi:hypothetical protein